MGVVVGGTGTRRHLTKEHLTLAIYLRASTLRRQGAEAHQLGACNGIQDGLARLDELLHEHPRANPQFIFNIFNYIQLIQQLRV